MSKSSQGIYQADILSKTNPKKGNGQWNLLIIAVDKLTAPQPTLIGLWLVITSPGNSNLTLVPIYPTSNLPSGLKNIAWQEAFSINQKQKLNADFLEVLSEHLLWDEYLMVDSNDIETILDQFTQNKLMFMANSTPEGDESVDRLNIDRNLDRQIEIWQAVCGELNTKSDSNELANWIDQIEPYVHTSFELNGLPHLQNNQANTHSQFTCEFPTLALNTP